MHRLVALYVLAAEETRTAPLLLLLVKRLAPHTEQLLQVMREGGSQGAERSHLACVDTVVAAFLLLLTRSPLVQLAGEAPPPFVAPPHSHTCMHLCPVCCPPWSLCQRTQQAGGDWRGVNCDKMLRALVREAQLVAEEAQQQQQQQPEGPPATAALAWYKLHQVGGWAVVLSSTQHVS